MNLNTLLNMQVFANGYIRFRSSTDNFVEVFESFCYADCSTDVDHTPSLFPQELNFTVAPFWADIDITIGEIGRVYYEVHVGFNESILLDEVSNFISTETGTPFVGEWMLLVEWRNVPAFFQSYELVSK